MSFVAYTWDLKGKNSSGEKPSTLHKNLFLPHGTWENISPIGGNKMADYLCVPTYRTGVVVVFLCGSR